MIIDVPANAYLYLDPLKYEESADACLTILNALKEKNTIKKQLVDFSGQQSDYECGYYILMVFI